jgi:hypothetical protein
MLERITLASAQPVLHRADGLVFPIRADWRSSEKTIRIPSEAAREATIDFQVSKKNSGSGCRRSAAHP